MRRVRLELSNRGSADAGSGGGQIASDFVATEASHGATMVASRPNAALTMDAENVGKDELGKERSTEIADCPRIKASQTVAEEHHPLPPHRGCSAEYAAILRLHR
jgi:hypothetical protein